MHIYKHKHTHTHIIEKFTNERIRATPDNCFNARAHNLGMGIAHLSHMFVQNKCVRLLFILSLLYATVLYRITIITIDTELYTCTHKNKF